MRRPSSAAITTRQIRIGTATTLVVACLALCSGCTSSKNQEPPPAAIQSSLPPDELFARASTAVVHVVIQNKQGREIGSGSGFLVKQGGLIVTNYHVIERAHAAQVVLADKTKLPVSGTAALDPDSDLAVLKVSGLIPAQPLDIAGGDPPPVGTKVYAIGSPLGLAQTLSDGLVSGHRELEDFTIIQTSAPISPGSSGGPLLGADGRVVGVTSASFTGGQNLNLAIPACQIRRLINRCAGEGKLTQFPLNPHPVANRGERGGAGGSTAVQSSSRRSTGPVVLTRNEAAKCSSQLRIRTTSTGPALEGYLYNGTNNMLITKAVFVVDTGRSTRDYAVDVDVKPQSSQNILVNIGPPGLRLHLQAFKIKSLTGVAARP